MRTARMPPREKGAKACLQDWAGHFLRSALRERFAQLRPIRAISQELRAVFSARQTLWRRERHSNRRYNSLRRRRDMCVGCGRALLKAFSAPPALRLQELTQL